MDALAIKTATAFKGNRRVGLPTVLATVTLLNPETGETLSVMDAGYLTAVRTGAASGVATKHLARPDAHVVAVFGAGTQGRTQLEAICEVRQIHEVRVFDVRAEAAEEFAEEIGAKEWAPDRIRVVESPTRALAGADIVATATTSPRPVFAGADLEPGTHVNGVGSHTPGTRELDTETVRTSRVVCDSVEACLAEAGDLLIPLADGGIARDAIHGALGDVILGRLPGRESSHEITLFKSVGLACQDASVALLAYERARQLGLGTDFQFHG
jgi:ornithine cyclodeaminase/alanine dehydrogenase-like protein (mu-crystallin family)